MCIYISGGVQNYLAILKPVATLPLTVMGQDLLVDMKGLEIAGD